MRDIQHMDTELEARLDMAIHVCLAGRGQCSEAFILQKKLQL